VAERLEENAIRLTEARYEARDTLRMLHDCNGQLTARMQALQTAETKLNEANDVLSAAKRHRGSTAEPREATFDTGTAGDSRLSLVQTAERANPKNQEMMLKTCSSQLAQERKDRLATLAAAQECTRQLKQSEHRLESKTKTLNICENQLKHAQENLTTTYRTLRQCTNDLTSAAKAVERTSTAVEHRGSQEQSAKSKVSSEKLRKCKDELTTTADVVRWKTDQMNKCADNLVITRGEVQSLTSRLSEAQSSHRTTVKNLKLQHHADTEELISNWQLRHQQQLEQAALDCTAAVNTLVHPINKTIFVFFVIFVYFFVIFVYCWFMSIAYNPLLLFANYARRLRAFVGIRQVWYRVNFRNPRHRE